MEVDEEDDLLDNSPLFYQPGKSGFYSLRPGKTSVERLKCFRNVGRLLALCLLQNELSPMSFNRHVIKYLLGKQVSCSNTLGESQRFDTLREGTRVALLD